MVKSDVTEISWVTSVEPKINIDNTKRKSKHKNDSFYRDSKSYPHKTKNGKGLITRLLERNK